MSIFKDLFRDYRFKISFAILLLLAAFACLSFFSPYDPTLWHEVPRDLPPSREHLLGTESRGIDIFWQASFAVRNSFIVAIIAGVISRLITVPIAMLAGYKGGLTDRVLMFISDSFLVIPLFLILVMLTMLVRESINLLTLGLLLAFFGWAWDARVIRSEILSLREREFTRPAILSGPGVLRMALNE